MLKIDEKENAVLRMALAAAAILLAVLGGAVACLSPGLASAASARSPLGPHVYLFTPSTPQSEIQATVDMLAAQQVGNEFGPQRYAILFAPGTYGSAATPLKFQIGYYTAVAGLGRSPDDVIINGSINVYNQCSGINCDALNNFWRSLSNLTINVTNPAGAGCYSGEFWAVSQAAPMRRVHVIGQTTLMDYCTQPSFSSGGFIADSTFEAGVIINGSQQQWLVRNSAIQSWTNGVWNQVFSGVVNAPTECFPGSADCGGPYTVLATSPVTREAPYLFQDAMGRLKVFVPAVQHDSSGTTWGNGNATPGRAIPLTRFFIAKPSDSAQAINAALAAGKNLLLTPGVYHLSKSLKVLYRDTVVMGLGFPTLVPQQGTEALRLAKVSGIQVSGIIIDAGPLQSPNLMEVGGAVPHGVWAGNFVTNPVGLHDVFFRVGGATPGRATNSLLVNTDNAILDNIWAWRADHGNGVGWNKNRAATGVIVNGKNVTAYGLFVEHYQKYETMWNGNRGTVVFFQNEMPYDPPNQAAWMSAPGVNGFAAFKLSNHVTRFKGYGMGSYSFFNQGVDIFAERAFEAPAGLPPGSFHDLLTLFLDPSAGKGGINHVINATGGSSTSANPDAPVTVVNYP